MARLFNGTSDHIRMDGANLNGTVQFDLSAHISYAFWVNCTGNPEQCFYAEATPGTAKNLFQLYKVVNTTVYGVFVRDNFANIILNVAGNLTIGDGAWHHFAYVQNGKVAGNTLYKTYVDGVLDLDSSFTLGAPFTLQSSACMLGYRTVVTTDDYWNGSIAHAASFGVALSANQIASLAGGCPPSHYVPIHYWPLWGDSPEADIGRGWTLLDGPIPSPRTQGTLTGTTVARGSEVGAGLLPFPGHVG